MSLSTTQYGYIVDPMVPFTDDKGKTIKNGFIRVFMAGTSTPVLTYRNYDGATNQEKIELDNSGRVKHNVIGSKGSLYKVVVYNILHSQENPLLTVDKIAVLGASINASGATIVTGLDSVTVQEENFLKATVEGTGVELALDPTEVTSEVSTTADAVTAAPDYVVPLLEKTGTEDSKKISLANIFKFALDWISRLATTITSFASGDYIAVSNTTDGTRKMSKDTLLELTAQNALADNVAPAFVPNETNAVAGLPYMYGGKLYVAKTDYNGDWDESKFERTPVYDLFYSKRFIEDESLIIIDKSKMFISGDITDAGDIGDTVDLTVTSSNWKCLVLDCNEGDSFFIRGSAGEGPRLWCFVDGDNKIISISEGSAATGAEGLRITAPADGKVIFNSGAAAGIGGPYFKSILSCQEFYEAVQNDLTEFKAETLVIGDITTNVGVGNVVNLTPSSDATYRNFVKDCYKGDSFLIKGIGGNSPRLWCFVDASNKVVSVSANGASSGESGLLVLAPVDGKIIFNTSVNAYSGDIFFKVPNNALDVIRENLTATSNHVDSLDGLTVVKKDVLSPYNYDRGYIATNVGVGNVVDLTPDYDYTYVFVVRDCKQGEEFYIRGNGGNVPRLWCFIDNNNKVISASEAYATTGENGFKIVAPADGKVIFNSGANPAYGAPYFKVKTNSQEYVDEKTGKIENFILARLHHEIHRDDTPYSGLPEELTGVTINASHIIEDIYGKFDVLCEEYSDYIEKFDAATLTGLEYPVYANGVPAGDPTYLETPAYKTYAYHIYDGRQNPKNVASFPKKKFLIVGTIHGHEFLAGLNLFALACHIVKNISGDLFDILSAFDIWLIPFVNGYGIYHGTRYNANGVDVNRNFGTHRWTSSGAGTPTYTGATPDSEFETKLVEGMYCYVSPDMYFDHHCSPGHQDVQIYTETPSVNFLTRSYQSLVNFSKAMVKNFPEYFGTNYHLFRDNTTYSGALPTAINPMQGCSDEWYYEHGVESCTLEVMGHINYLNGEYNADGAGAENTDLLVINEFVLRSQLVDFLPIVLR